MATYLREHSQTETTAIPLAADVLIESGALACVNANGELVPADDPAAATIAGRAEFEFDNTGGLAGDEVGHCKLSVYHCANDETNPLTTTDFGEIVYLVNGHTVASTGTVIAGICRGITPDGQVVVDTRLAATL